MLRVGAIYGLVLALGCLLAPDAAAASNSWLRTWIPASCCVTNDCCFEVRESDLRSLPGDLFQVVASGQVLARTDFSPDGRHYRCACDYIKGQWVVSPTSHTRCIFTPMQAF